MYMNEPRARGVPPFKTLGTQLKQLREQVKESLAEVSGAVEIDTEELEKIEDGSRRPSEEILLLLISHFGMQGSEALRLWEMAGYSDMPSERFTVPQEETAANNKPVVMLMAMDMRTVYSDGIDVTANQSGVMMNFSQTVDQSQKAPVAKVGMSYEQAEQVLHTLQQALLKAKYSKGPKALPPSVDS